MDGRKLIVSVPWPGPQGPLWLCTNSQGTGALMWSPGHGAVGKKPNGVAARSGKPRKSPLHSEVAGQTGSTHVDTQQLQV